MPLILQNTVLKSQIQYGVWQIDEDEQFFIDQLQLPSDQLAELQKVQPKRRIESLASRYVLHHLTESTHPWPLAKTIHQKPYFTEHTEWYCSLSHSHGVVAAAFGRHECGIDLQRFTTKMSLLAPKFVNELEKDWIDTQYQDESLTMFHYIWSAKEAMYKVYGRKQLDFRMHLVVDPVQPHGGQSSGMIHKIDERHSCALHYERILVGDEQYCLVVAG